MSPQTLFRSRAVDFFNWQLQSLAPPDLEVVREFTIDVDFQNRPEPDVVVVRADAVESLRQTVPREQRAARDRGRVRRVRHA